MEVEHGGIELTANNMDMGIRTSLIEAHDVDGIFSVALDAKLFTEIVKKLPDGDINISVGENRVTTISSGKAKFKINGENPEEFPTLDTVARDNRFILPAGILRKMIRQTIFAVSLDPSKPTITGELLKIDDGHIHCVAVDMFRIAHRFEPIEAPECPVDIIIPADTLDEISKLISGTEDSEVSVCFTDKQIMFELDAYTVVSRRLEGEFIKFKDHFKTVATSVTTADRLTLIAAIERACIVAVESGRRVSLKLDIGSDSITVSSQTELGAAHDEIPATTTGDGLTIFFNPRYLLEALKAIEDSEVALHFIAPKSPMVIRPVAEGNYAHLVVPLRGE